MDMYVPERGYQVSFPGIKRPGRGTDNSTPSNTKVKEIVQLTSTPPLGLHGLLKGEPYFTLQQPPPTNPKPPPSPSPKKLKYFY